MRKTIQTVHSLAARVSAGSRHVRPMVIMVLCALLVIPQPVNAIGFDQEFYSSNDILYYNPNASACNQGQGTSASGSATPDADEMARAGQVMEYLTSQMGMTLVQASGFAGNMHAESNINPRAVQSQSPTTNDNYQPVNGQGFGLIQWTFTSRQQPLVDLAKSTNRNTTDMNLQMDLVKQELTTSYKSTLMALSAVSDLTPEQAAIIVHGRTANVKNDPRFSIAPELGFEASGDTVDGVMNHRAAYAKTYYDNFNGKIKDGSGITGGVSTSLQSSNSAACSGASSAVVSDTCSVTAPVYGEGGNGQQLDVAGLTKAFGQPNDSGSLTNIDFMGKSVQVNKAVVGCLNAVANELKTNNVTYSFDVVGCFRQEDLNNIKYHGFGAACDINPDTNPCFYVSTGEWCYISKDGTTNHDIPQAVVDAFHHHGWSWGGGWGGMKDYMHFEFNGVTI